MKNILFHLAILISLLSMISCYQLLDKKIVFFDGIDFESGDYKVLVYGTEGEWIDGYMNFYIDDIETLKKMKKQWVFRFKSDVMPCGYGYNLLLVNRSEVLKKTSINIDCEYMGGWIRFPINYLKDHQKSFKRMTQDDRAEFSKTYFKKE